VVSRREKIVMATVINNPDSGGRDGGGSGVIVGVIVAIIILVLFFLYALPAIRGTTKSGTTVNIPDKINVDVNQQPSGGTGGQSNY